ncbi:DUF2505 domain-containing protein [Nocardioides sp. cx-169]|uniref:DUF2505 domain-containing protein n=1 Tax=Nocardioides sp. cx-169 TaxID=2899080 RepID=UPI001E4311DA|nr:DUF2505 domain-containing protein [Nocardioides sp. cx-169]MCD4533913.1 DUF2505 domain-containing protein [Nocardioides sp. cx-169]
MLMRTELSYDAPPADVFAMLSDPAFRERVCEAQHAASYDVSVDVAGAGLTVRVETEQNTSGLPSIAKKFVGETTTAIMTETWKDGSGGAVDISAPGKPTKVTGSVTLREAGTGTVQTVELDAKVKVPLIGGKLEQLLVDTLQAAYAKEQQVGTSWLAGER